MSSISGISGSSAWSNMSAMRGNRPPGGMDPAKMFAKVDSDSSGGVDQTELQNLLDDVSQKTGATLDSAEKLFSTMDSNSDGNLSQDELSEGMKSVMPPPPSTMDFAQARSGSSNQSTSDDLFGKVDSDGNGSVSKDELLALLDQMEAEHGTSGDTKSTDADDRFAQLDVDGNGSLSQAEFEAGRPQGGQGPQGMGGMPPPPPPGGAGGSSTSYDPLDTNEDGIVSAAERAAGSASNDSVQALFDAIDTDGDSAISSDEANAFIQTLRSESETSSTRYVAAGSQGGGWDLSSLVSKAYDEMAGQLGRQIVGSSLSALV